MNLFAYVGGMPEYFGDPFGTKRGSGHHLIPWSIFNEAVRAEVFEIFNGDEARLFHDDWKSHNFGSVNDVKHHDYNKAVRAELEVFLSGKPISEMTTLEAKEFLERIKTMPSTSTIGKFNKGIKGQIKDAIKKAAEESAKRLAQGLPEKVAEKGLKRCCKKGAGFCIRKFPITAIGFFCYDASQGGFAHACNELTWPISEFWVED
jgi:hypothetical protein